MFKCKIVFLTKLRTLVLLCFFVWNHAMAEDEAQTMSTEPGNEQQRKLTEKIILNLTIASIKENAKSDPKVTLAEMLDYRGVDDFSGPRDISPIPRYVKYVLKIWDYITLSKPSHMHPNPTAHVYPTFWAIVLNQATWSEQYIELQYMIQAEVHRVNIDRAELVFPERSQYMTTYYSRYGRRSKLSEVRICGTEDNECHPWEVEHRPKMNTIRTPGQGFDSYDVTVTFKKWLKRYEDREMNHTVPLLAKLPMNDSVLDHYRIPNKGKRGPMLVIYSNVEELLQSMDELQRVKTHEILYDRVRRSSSRMKMRRTSSGAASQFIHPPIVCSPIEWYLNFSIIGLGQHIIQPPGYYANLCLGSCDLTMMGNYIHISHHALWKTLYVLDVEGSPGPTPSLMPTVSCVPVGYEPISLLVDPGSNNIVQRRIYEARASTCGCK